MSDPGSPFIPWNQDPFDSPEPSPSTLNPGSRDLFDSPEPDSGSVTNPGSRDLFDRKSHKSL